MDTMTCGILATLLSLLGTVLAIASVLAIGFTSTIASSVLVAGGAGTIHTIFDPDKVINFTKARNRALLSLFLLLFGFLLSLPALSTVELPIGSLVVIAAVVILVVLLIPGFSRMKLLKSWQGSDCAYRWYFDLLDRSQMDDYLDRHTESGTEYAIHVLMHVYNALQVKSTLQHGNDFLQLEDLRRKLVENLSQNGWVYYFKSPSALLRAYV